MKTIKVGISQCLLGAKVRFDGGHKNSRFCQNELSRIFEFTPLCPEVGIGLPIPRKTIRLVGDIADPRAVFSHDESHDLTDQLENFSEQKAPQLAAMSGYIFCKGSPSCGLERVKVYDKNGSPQSKGRGVFAAKVSAMFPLMPMEEDGRLNDPLLRDSFIKRVYIYNEWRRLETKGLTRRRLYHFHARHKLMLLAHCQRTYRELGPLVASINQDNLRQVADKYIMDLMRAVKKMATRSNNTNVLMHIQGYLKEALGAKDKEELTRCILEYRKGILPFLSPLTLLKHHFQHFPNNYVAQQSFMNPYPKELAIQVGMH